MTIGTTARSPLDGLISCGRCESTMHFKPASLNNDAQYYCDQDKKNPGHQHHPLSTPVTITDHLALGSILNAIFTDEALSTVMSTMTDLGQGQNTPPILPIEDLALLRQDPQFFLKTLRTPTNARNFLASFITSINLYSGKIVIHYSMPLPSHSHLAGSTKQEVLLSSNLTQ